MQSESAWQHPESGIATDVLNSMIAELVTHHQRHGALDDQCLDWQSPSKRTRVVCYTNRHSLYNVLHQVPDALAAEYELYHRGAMVYLWHEYQWPHLQGEQTTANVGQKIHIPRDCHDELMRFHVNASTGWLIRYRQRLRRDRGIKVNEIGIVTESDWNQ